MDRTIQGRQKRNPFLSLMIVGVLLSSVSCEAGAFLLDPLALPDGPAFSLSPSGMTLGVGESATVSATLAKANGSPVNPQSLKWESAHVSVATVTRDGVVTGAAPGNTIIIASSGRLADTTWVAVVERAPGPGVRISPDTVVLKWLNATATMTAEVRDDAGTLVAQPGLTWKSLNPEIATADNMGVITAKGVGMALIVATAACCDQADTAHTRVYQAVDSVAVEPESVSLSEGSSVQLRATAMDRGGSTIAVASFEYRSGDESVAQVTGDGLLTGQSSGTTTATASSDGHSDAVAVTVSGSVPSGTTSAGRPNEPAGFKAITLHDGNTIKPSGWWLHDPDGNLSIVQQQNAPVPSSGVIQYRYPEGLQGGTGPGMIGHGSGYAGSSTNVKADGQHVREIYLSYWFKLDPNWQAPSGGESKLYYVYAAERDVSRHHIFPIISGTGTLSMRFRNMVSERPSILLANVSDPELKRGEWYHLEIHARNASVPGGNDGLVRWWLNGRLAGDHQNLDRPALPWTELHGNMVWGGGSTTPVQRDQYIWLNDLYMSGRP
jgi:uncharacterized protein YjdB